MEVRKTVGLEGSIHVKIKTVKGDQKDFREDRALQAGECACFSGTGLSSPCLMQRNQVTLRMLAKLGYRRK